MALERHILPSSYPSRPLPHLEILRLRQPLQDSAGNAQHNHMLASSNIFNGQKGTQPRLEQNSNLRFSLPTLPSQRDPQSVSSQLERRRASNRAVRSMRTGHRNPIIDSPQYQAYRDRQPKSSQKDQKWPDDLEEAFLDALLDIPRMGRRKFSINSKPHGRNELIALYIDIAYRQSLPPGVQPDPTKERARKQVSSHIQVLKGFMQGHPSYDRLFPKTPVSKNSFDDNFKNDPTLRALAQGRLPRRRSYYGILPPIEPEFPSNRSDGAIRPCFFDINMVVPPSSPFNGIKSESSSDQPTIVHTYCSQELRPLPRDTLEILPNWRIRFPNLAEAHAADQLTCPIIHLSASLNLRHGKSPDGAELWGHFEILIPSPADPRTEWQCKQSVSKPADLYGDASIDPPIAFGDKDYILSPEKEEPGLGTIVRVSFPALPWAHALGKLADLQERFEEALRNGAVAPTTISARQYIEQISMYQEIYSRTSPYAPWTRRAAIAWTFSKAKSGEKGTTCWRYLDAPPARRDVFSPHPGDSHVAQASMNENFNAWAGGVSLPESQGLNIQLSVPAETSFFMAHGGGISTGLATSPQTALLSPFEPYSYQHHDVSGEHLNFMSQQVADHENTLVEATAAHNLNSFLSNEAVGLEGFDQGHNLWPGSTADAFVATEWAGTYALPGAEALWDVGEGLKAQGWADDTGGFR